MNKKKIFSIVLAAIMLFATASAVQITTNAETETVQPEYLKHFDNITFTTVLSTPAGDVLPDGQTVEDNLRSRYFTEVTGLIPKVMWSAAMGDAFQQKLNMAIATGDIPDYFEVNYNQYLELVATDQLADLTDYMDLLHPAIKDCYASADNVDLNAVTFHDHIYGIPKANGLGNSTPILWVRQDWMDKLGLDEPKCIEDIATIARAFMNGDPDGDGIKNTEGLSIRAKYKTPGGDGGVCDIFANYGAYLNQYNMQEDGTVILGTIQPEALEALKLLNSWYKEGIIAKDFATVDGTSYLQKVSSEKTGLFFGYWYDSWGCLTDTVLNNPNARWSAYCLPKEAGQDYICAEGNPAKLIGVISKKVQDPSMFIYALNDVVEAMFDEEYEAKINEIATINNSYDPMTVYSLPADAIITTGVLASKYAAGEITLDEVKERSYPTEAIYNTAIAVNAKVVAENGDHPYDNIEAWSNAIGYTIGMVAEYNSNIQFHRSDFVGKTETMEKSDTFLEKYVTEAYTKMIMGDTDGMTIDDFFAKFVEQYLANGGQKILDEVQIILSNK